MAMIEFKLIQNAVYTEPRDQSAWMYHNWLIGQGYTLLADEQTRAAILAQDEASISDLYELEPEVKCKSNLLAFLANRQLILI